MKSLLAIIYLVGLSIVGEAQNKRTSITIAELDSLPVSEGLETPNFVPITFQKQGIEFKKEFEVSGVIREQSSAGFYCGVMCHSGTMKIEIAASPNGKDSLHPIYVLIPCFVHDEKDIGRTINVTLTNLPEDREIGCYRVIWNTIDSNGEAFYYCEKWEIK